MMVRQAAARASRPALVRAGLTTPRFSGRGSPPRHCLSSHNGTANLFIFLDVHRPWRKVKVTDSRTAIDFAACMQELVDAHGAARI
jgi:hypothetical protein